MAVMTNEKFVSIAKDIAKNYKTLYVMGCFGSPLNTTNKKRYTSNHSYNKQASRTKKINNATIDTFGFDCVCLIKAILWGWNGNKSKTYGGATYCSNGVPDIGADKMITVCSNISTNFSNIEVGEVVWLKGHIGIYIGDGLVVESTPIWKDGVQITALGNIGSKQGYNSRKWTKHGKLPYIDYIKKEKTKREDVTVGTYSLTNTKYVRKSPKVANNRFKVKELKAKGEGWTDDELKMLVSKSNNDYAQLKKGSVLQITKISKEGINIWGKYGDYGTDWICLYDITGSQADKL